MPAKAGRTLFKERADSFHAIVGVEAFQLMLDLPLESVGQGFLVTCKNSLLYSTDGHLGAGGDFGGKVLHFGLKAIIGINVVKNANVQGFLSCNHLARVEKLSGYSWADKLGQEESAAIIWKESYFREILSKDSLFDGNPNIRSERKVHARTSGRTIHRCDHRLRHSADLQDGLHARSKDWRELRVIACGASPADDTQVAPGAKSAPGAGQNHDVDGMVRGDSCQGFIQRSREVIVQGIQAIRTIHC